MIVLYILTGALLAASIVADRGKTWAALKNAAVRFTGFIPVFLVMLMLVSVILTLVPGYAISNILGRSNKWVGLAFGAALGSITIMPGFIAFPLCAVLLQKGVAWMVLSIFSTTLMMVGVVTFPVEKEAFGFKLSLARNLVGLLIAVAVALVTGLYFGEIG
jgi:uncharacterized membrane protein YraQ (UPF0718 family)